MLFDGGIELPEGAPATWKLTGWGGNTCTYLGFKPLNGQRRENLEFRTTVNGGIGGTNVDDDPLVKAGITRPAAMDLRKDLASEQDRLKE